MTFHKVGYEKYNVTMKISNKDMLIATVRQPLIGLNAIFIDMYFPFEECSTVRLDTTYMVESEMIEVAKRWIMKKLYKIQSDILLGIQSVDFEYEKYKNEYRIIDVFSRGDVYAIN
ncbi:hypothetical protein [uncultured Robinsoniella sp.]|uniref:hypothetical protein n=1 Tax=uncultured Robinsoniella sp. TaxID=904190 RepID=UPI00374F4849